MTVYEAATWQAVAAYEWGGEPLWSVCFSPDGGSIAGGSDGGRVVIWNAPDAALGTATTGEASTIDRDE